MTTATFINNPGDLIECNRRRKQGYSNYRKENNGNTSLVKFENVMHRTVIYSCKTAQINNTYQRVQVKINFKRDWKHYVYYRQLDVQQGLDNSTWAPVAISSAASFITPNVWKANTQSSRSQTVGCTEEKH